MKKNKQVRDLVYVSGDIEAKLFYSYGIEFPEFMNSCKDRPKTLVLLKHNFDHSQWNFRSRFDFVNKDEIDRLIDDDVYGYGDFCWIDLENEAELDRLSDEDIAELLFFGHLAKPLHQASLSRIINRFAYYAHDDGWFNKLYVNSVEDYKTMLANVIIDKLRIVTDRIVSSFPEDISSILLDRTIEGLFIDFRSVIKNRTQVRLPVTVVGHYTDMDKVYSLRDEIDIYKIWLEYSKETWKLINEG